MPSVPVSAESDSAPFEPRLDDKEPAQGKPQSQAVEHSIDSLETPTGLNETGLNEGQQTADDQDVITQLASQKPEVESNLAQLATKEPEVETNIAQLVTQKPEDESNLAQLVTQKPEVESTLVAEREPLQLTLVSGQQDMNSCTFILKPSHPTNQVKCQVSGSTCCVLVDGIACEFRFTETIKSHQIDVNESNIVVILQKSQEKLWVDYNLSINKVEQKHAFMTMDAIDALFDGHKSNSHVKITNVKAKTDQEKLILSVNTATETPKVPSATTLEKVRKEFQNTLLYDLD